MNTTAAPNSAFDPKFKAELTSIGARLLQAYLECSAELQQSAREMAAIISAPDSDDDERAMALHTLQQIFFPQADDCAATLEELDDCAAQLQPDGAAARAALDRQEATFAERLRALMQQHNLTQTELAARAGVGQPAISMMLQRRCRPQQRTVRKLAEALGVSAAALWSDEE